MGRQQRPVIIVMTGPESAGKTTLGQSLAQYFHCPLVEEQARSYLENLDRDYSLKDIVRIGELQKDAILKEMQEDPPCIFVDTWIYVLMIWSKVRFGKIPNQFLEWRNAIDIDLFVLCNPEQSWEPDPLREHPNNRDQLFSLYLNALTRDQARFEIAQGNILNRVNQITKRIDSFL